VVIYKIRAIFEYQRTILEKVMSSKDRIIIKTSFKAIDPPISKMRQLCCQICGDKETEDCW
jgi:hypothetical protein